MTRIVKKLDRKEKGQDNKTELVLDLKILGDELYSRSTNEDDTWVVEWGWYRNHRTTQIILDRFQT